ncbi:CDP-glycerol glycerophosphotransferase family protein [Oceanobacillus caeni]|uniref:CDP-glycerol glycerophosphotransferase family protein n=1 Tax=Oceanobacillus caeni TaxID=405946 RepID=UPI00195F0184|nr:CDP-glycerol glycerophosphotransferase family protein [Oceanobacillus caeni]MBU8790798.1 CDP-glycerol glycerophosphotransferase family protein [Oceanobacillus caeni]MCR1835509.1 CDP-glycerol glycerophosphotransferase family protein [Oceanobacillus caeni]
MRPFISLCMIVKNEEKVIERCLSSISRLVDEVVVVDTGSTDRTKEIVSRYTSKIYDFEWINDFSAARNYAASKAAGEWILVLDADEYVDEENFKDFILKLKEDNGQYDSYFVKILNFAGSFGETLVQNFHDRIYKNNGEISYYRKIHEQFKTNSGKPLKNSKSNLLIFHSGYLKNTVVEKEKRRRNKELIDKEIKYGSNKAFDHFNIGNEYCSIGEYEKALDAYLAAYKLKKDFRLAWVSTALIQIIICLINLKRYNDALNVIVDAEKIYANSPEFPCLKGEIFFLRGQLEDAKSTFQELIENNEKYQHIILRPDLKDQRPHLRLGEIFLNQEEYNGAIYHFTNVLNINNNNIESINKVVCLLNKFHTEDEIATFLKTNNLVNENNIQIYVRACFDVGNPSLALNLLKEYTDKYRLLQKASILKRLCISNVGDIDEINGILQSDVLEKLLESNWINIVDILLLNDYVSQEYDLIPLINSMKQSKQIRELMDLLDGNEYLVNLDENLIVYTLQQFFIYKRYDLCNVILEDIEKTNKGTILKVARILFSNEFKGEALQLYDLCDWDRFNEQDFINIIDSLIETNDKESVLEVAKLAMDTFEEDFRFYKYVLENTMDNFVFKKVSEKVNKIFTHSEYLKNVTLTNEKNLKDEESTKIIITEQNKILDVFLKYIDKYLINHFSLKKDEFTVCYPYISFLNKDCDFASIQFLLVVGNDVRKSSTIEVVKEEEQWILQNLKMDGVDYKQKKIIQKQNYITKKPKVLLGYRDYSGCNTLALYKSIPSYITDNFQIEFVKAATNEFSEKALKSDVIVTTNMEFNPKQISDIGEKIIIDTWHGFPLKNMFYTDPYYFYKNSIEQFWSEVDFLTSYSNLYSNTINNSIKVDPEKYIITGSPRNDFLFNQDTSRKLLLELLGKEDNGQRFIFYMPTFRNEDVQNSNSSSNLFGFKDFNLDSLENFLNVNNYELIVKLHPLYKKNLSGNLFSYSRISMYPEHTAYKETTDLYEVLSATDILITDYSSIYFDYLLLDKPIVFATPDLEQYQEERGFCLKPFENWTPGPKVVTQEQLQCELIKYEKDKDYYSLFRKEIKDKVHQYKDGKSSERVWKFISSLYC